MKFLTLEEKTNPAIALNSTLCFGEGLALLRPNA